MAASPKSKPSRLTAPTQGALGSGKNMKVGGKLVSRFRALAKARKGLGDKPFPGGLSGGSRRPASTSPSVASPAQMSLNPRQQ